MKSNWLVIGLPALLIAVAILVAMNALGDKDSNLRPYHSANPEPQGSLAFYRLLESEGFKVERFRTNYEKLPEGRHLLVLFENSKYSWDDLDLLLDWVYEGGIVLSLGNPGYQYTVTDRAESVQSGEEYKARTYFANAWTPRKAVARAPDPKLRLTPEEGEWTPLMGDVHGITISIEHWGEGAWIQAVEPGIATNAHIAKENNAAILASIAHRAKPESVLFDDCALGDCRQASGSPLVSWPSAWRVFIWHVGLLTAMVMLSVGRRFGLARPEPRRIPMATDYVEAMSRLYGSASARAAALETILEQAVRSVARQNGIAAAATIQQLLERLPKGSEQATVIKEAQELIASAHLSAADAVRTAVKLAEITR